MQERTKLLFAPIQADSLRPVTELAADIAKQNQGNEPCDAIFWNDLIASIRSGYFDADRPIYLLQESRRQLNADEINELINGERVDAETAGILNPLVRSCWASVKTLSTWAKSKRYEPPSAWQEAVQSIVLNRPLSKRQKTEAAIIDFLRQNPVGKKELKKNYYPRIAALVAASGIKASTRLVRGIGEKRERSGRNGRNGIL